MDRAAPLIRIGTDTRGFTTADGDTVYAISGAESERVTASLDAVGALAATLLEAAIVDAVRSAALSEAEFLQKVVQ